MELVVDANVFIAALISPKGHTADVFFSPFLEVCAPDTIFEEIKEHLEELVAKTGLSAEDFANLLNFLAANLRLFLLEELGGTIEEARNVSPDPDDVAYLALALKLRCPLWSNDKALKSQSVVKVLSTPEVLQLLKS